MGNNVQVTYANGEIADNIFNSPTIALEVFASYQFAVDNPNHPDQPVNRAVKVVMRNIQ